VVEVQPRRLQLVELDVRLRSMGSVEGLAIRVVRLVLLALLAPLFRHLITTSVCESRFGEACWVAISCWSWVEWPNEGFEILE
jgi:Fe2+ transport system protein FeoA